MRFVSHSPRFTVQVVEQRAHATQYGDMIVDREPLYAVFNQDDVTDADLAFAAATWPTMPGFAVLIDEVTPVPILDRVSVYDTDEEAKRHNWEGQTTTDARGVEHDLKTYVENFLASRSERHADFRKVEDVALAPPWPNYLQFRGTLDQLVRILVDQGHDLGYALRFERQQRRQAVVDAIEAEMERQSQEIADAPQVLA